MVTLCDRDVADEDAIMSVEGGVEVGKSAVPGPSESRDESKSLVGNVYCYLTDIPWREA